MRRIVDAVVMVLLLAAILTVAVWADSSPLDEGTPPTGTTQP